MSLLFEEEDLPWLVPLRIYGDGADAQRNQPWEMFTMLPILGMKSSTLDSRLLLAIRNTTYTTSDCRDLILETIAWSFDVLSNLKP